MSFLEAADFQEMQVVFCLALAEIWSNKNLWRMLL